MLRAGLKKGVALAMAVIILLAMAPVALAVGVPTEEAFGELVHTFQAEFPVGKYWNDANGRVSSGRYRGSSLVGDRSCVGYGCGSLAIEGNEWAWQCHGYAMLLADRTFGSFYNIDSTNWVKTTYKRGQFSGELYAGDVVRIVLPSGNGHSVFVYKVTADTVYYTQCNRHNRCQLDWDTESLSAFKNRITYVHHFQGNTLKGTMTVTPQLAISYNANGGTISAANGKYHTDSSGLIFSKESGSAYQQNCYMGISYPNGLADAATFGLEREGYLFMGWSATPKIDTLWSENQAFLPEQIAPYLAYGDQSQVMYAVWKDLKSELPFLDVHTNHWYYNSVQYTAQKGFMNGTSSIAFAPEDATTRAMLVTVLHRIEGSPAPQSAAAFSDVSAGQWYTNAVAWAAENNIVNGMGENLFAPDGKITREQMTTVLFRYAQFKQKDEGIRAPLEAFADQSMVADWSKEGAQWAVAKGIINGIAEGNQTHLQPQGNATRAQIATVLMRYDKEILK